MSTQAGKKKQSQGQKKRIRQARARKQQGAQFVKPSQGAGRQSSVARRGARNPARTLPADQLMKMGGAHGKNPLALAHQEKSHEIIAAVNQDSTLDVNPVITSASLIYTALGIVLRAKKKGWGLANNGEEMYQAFCYTIDVLRSAIKGSTLEFTAAPRWFWELCAALAPKERFYLTNRVYYETTIQETQPTLGSTIPLGAAPDELYSVIFGSPIGPPINGYPTIQPAGPYIPSVGKEQFSSMWNVFFAKQGEPTEIVGPIGDKAYCKKDCSAFAQVTSRAGTSFFAPGGFANRLESEVHIDSPLLSKYCNDNDEDDLQVPPYRAGFCYHASGGTPCYIGPRLSEMENLNQIRNKGRMIPKVYDFDEFFEVASMILANVQEAVLSQTEITPEPYPLTAQQFRLILRQCLIPFFDNDMAQDLRHKTATLPDPVYETMLPLTVCDNGVSQTALADSMLFPRFFVEMCKGVMRVTADVGRFKDGRVVMDWVPVLMRKNLDELQGYTYGEGTPLFVPAPPGQVSVRTIDCSAVVGADVVYLSLNGFEQSEAITLHNNWMTRHQPFMSGLASLTATKGTALLSTIMTTKIVRRVILIDNPLTTKQVGQVLGVGLGSKASQVTQKGGERRKSLENRGVSIRDGKKVKIVNPLPGSDFFQSEEARSIASNLPFLKELEEFQSCLITPVIATANTSFSAGHEYIQSYYGEGIQLSLGNQTDGGAGVFASTFPTMYQLHQRLASLDCKNIANSSRTRAEVLLDALEEKGEGGWLTTISKILTSAGGFAEKASKFIPL